MAYNQNITAAEQIFYDADRLLSYAIYSGNPTAAQIAAGQVTPINITGWTLSWTLRKKVGSEALIHKTVGDGITIVGVYDADPLVNTQRIEVRIEDTDTYDPGEDPVWEIKPGTYVYALKRLDDGAETPLAYGTLVIVKTAGWEAP